MNAQSFHSNIKLKISAFKNPSFTYQIAQKRLGQPLNKSTHKHLNSYFVFLQSKYYYFLTNLKYTKKRIEGFS